MVIIGLFRFHSSSSVSAPWFAHPSARLDSRTGLTVSSDLQAMLTVSTQALFINIMYFNQRNILFCCPDQSWDEVNWALDQQFSKCGL